MVTPAHVLSCRAMLGRRRRLASWIHLWGGVLAAAPVIVLSLSGAALVFRAEFEDILNRPPDVAHAAPPPRSLDAVIAAALLAHPGAEPRGLWLPRDEAYRVELDTGGRRLDVAVDPVTLHVIASRAAERSVFVAVHSLHARLHAGAAGALAVALVGVWLVVVSISGLRLYAGARRRRIARRVTHRWLGIPGLVLGVIVGVTGGVLALALALAPVATPSPRGRLARADALVVLTERVASGRVTAIVADAPGAIRIDRIAGGRVSSLVVDVQTGAVAAAARADDAWAIVRHLHYGDFAGWPSRGLYAAAGVVLPILAVTGFLLWTRRRG